MRLGRQAPALRGDVTGCGGGVRAPSRPRRPLEPSTAARASTTQVVEGEWRVVFMPTAFLWIATFPRAVVETKEANDIRE